MARKTRIQILRDEILHTLAEYLPWDDWAKGSYKVYVDPAMNTLGFFKAGYEGSIGFYSFPKEVGEALNKLSKELPGPHRYFTYTEWSNFKMEKEKQTEISTQQKVNSIREEMLDILVAGLTEGDWCYKHQAYIRGTGSILLTPVFPQDREIILVNKRGRLSDLRNDLLELTDPYRRLGDPCFTYEEWVKHKKKKERPEEIEEGRFYRVKERMEPGPNSDGEFTEKIEYWQGKVVEVLSVVPLEDKRAVLAREPGTGKLVALGSMALDEQVCITEKDKFVMDMKRMFPFLEEGIILDMYYKGLRFEEEE